MSTPINLNKARKARANQARRLRADENAVKFGRSKEEKAAQDASNAQQVTRLEGHKREP